jgi:type IX secretion system PorP/SprF family membrane protein
MLRRVIIMYVILSCSVAVIGQELNSGPAYQTLLINNPGLSGSEGESILRISYINYYPGRHFNLNSGSVSYDSYIPALHGGTGAYISEDYLGGIVNDLKGGLSYAYFLRAGKNLYINAGLSASVFHRGYSFADAVLPDQIDGVGGVSLPSAESLDARGKTVFDLGAGFILISGKYSGGLAVSHLAEPELYSSVSYTEKIKRLITIHAESEYKLGDGGILKAQPLLLGEFQGGYFSAGAGASLVSRGIAVNALLYVDNRKNTDLQAGVALKLKSISIFYNYLFNLKSGNTMLPVSLKQQAGLSMSLSNVEKRKETGTINFPKM